MGPEVRLRAAFGEVKTKQLTVNVRNFGENPVHFVRWHVIHEFLRKPLSIFLALLPDL
jgi:hypothetical protein